MQTYRLNRHRLWGLLCAALALILGGITAAPAADFYAGKTLTVLVGYAPGGGVDTTARAMTRHLARFIPGHPNIVVQNMEGAAGLVSANYLSSRVKPDGLTIAVPGRSWYIEAILHPKKVTFDPVKLAFIGSPGAVSSAAFVRIDSGIKSFADLKKSKKPVTFGALGSRTATAMVPRMLAANGIPIKVVQGYVSSSRVLHALEQGEVEGYFTVEDTFAARPDLIGKVVTLILQSAPKHPGLPLLSDVIPREQQPLLNLVMAPDGMGLPMVGPAGMPADIIAILRKAFMAMAQDKDYQADAKKINLPIGEPIDGAALQKQIAALVASATPKVVDEFNQLAAKK
jgi:tripartite-type tricarboxylate transporter receptor subunit TctC